MSQQVRRRFQAFLAIALAVATALASSLVLSHVAVAYPGMVGCELGCQFLAGGWPFPYIVDHPGISPSNSISLIEALLGVDVFWPGHFLATLFFWFAAFTVVLVVANQRKKHRHAT
jgi:hypothetical protein